MQILLCLTSTSNLCLWGLPAAQGGSKDHLTKGYWVAWLLCWGNRGKVPVRSGLTRQTFGTLGANISSDADSLSTAPELYHLWTGQLKANIKSLFSTEINKTLTKLSTPPIRGPRCKREQVQQKQQQQQNPKGLSKENNRNEEERREKIHNVA